MTQEKIKELIFDFLSRHPITIEDFAKSVGVAQNSVRFFLKGKSKLQVKTWKRLDEFFENMLKQAQIDQ